jgi:hypothetical protein
MRQRASISCGQHLRRGHIPGLLNVPNAEQHLYKWFWLGSQRRDRSDWSHDALDWPIFLRSTPAEPPTNYFAHPCTKIDINWRNHIRTPERPHEFGEMVIASLSSIERRTICSTSPLKVRRIPLFFHPYLAPN